MSDDAAALVKFLAGIAVLFVIVLALRRWLRATRRLRGSGNPYYDFDAFSGDAPSLPDAGRQDSGGGGHG